jgi:hypothetical protein
MPPSTTPRNYLKIIKLVSASIVLLIIAGMVLNYFFTNGQLVIDIKAAQGKESTVTITGPSLRGEKVVTFANSGQQTVWLPVGEYSVSLNQEYRNTLTSGKVEAFKQNKVSASLKDEISSSRLAAESYGCGYVSGDTYYNWECFEPSQIYRHTTEGNVPISEDLYTSVTPLGNGVLAFTYIPFADMIDLVYLDPGTNQKIFVRIPDFVYEEGIEDVMLTVNQVGNSEYQFALVQRAKNLWLLFKDANDSNPRQVSPGTPKEDGLNISAPQLSGDKLVNLFANIDYDQHGEGGELTVDPNAAPSQLRVYSLRDNKLEGQYALPKDTAYSSVHIVQSGLVVAEHGRGGLSVFKALNNNLDYLGIIPDTENLMVSENRIYFNREGSVFELGESPLAAYRLFSADGFKVASLTPSGSKILMQTFTGAASQSIQNRPSAYVLDLTKVASYPRPEWDLSASRAKESPAEQPVSGDHGESDAVTFNGVEGLLDVGLSAYQADNLRYAFIQYAKSANITLNQIDIDKSSINQKYRDWQAGETKTEVTFKAKINGKETVDAKLHYWDIEEIQLFISKGGAQVFDSGQVNIHR